MKKIIEILNRLTTVRNDISKHIVGSMFSMWIILWFYVLFGKTYALIASIGLILLMVVWEFYHMIVNKKPFSMADVMAGVVPMIPFLIMITETK